MFLISTWQHVLPEKQGQLIFGEAGCPRVAKTSPVLLLPSVFRLTVFPWCHKKGLVSFSQTLRLLAAEKVTPAPLQPLPSPPAPFRCALCKRSRQLEGPCAPRVTMGWETQSSSTAPVAWSERTALCACWHQMPALDRWPLTAAVSSLVSGHWCPGRPPVVQRGLLASSATVLGRTCCSNGRQRPLLMRRVFPQGASFSIFLKLCSFCF